MAKRKRSSRRSYGASAKRIKSALKHMDRVRVERRAFALVNPRGSTVSQTRFGVDFKSASADQRMQRSLFRYKGLGDYGENALNALSNLTSVKIGGNQYGLFNFGHGSSNSAQTAFKGLGDYGPVTTNSLAGGAGTISVNAGPRTSTGDISFSHTEFIQNVVVTSTAAIGNTAFQLQAFNLNPGMSSTFPFLSQIACNYSMWEVHGLMFQYKPTSGEYGSSGSNSLGKVIMATQYDSSAPVFTSSQEMENYVGASSTKPSCGMVHGIETAPRERLTNLMYVRSGASSIGNAPVGQKDRNLTDLGLFQIATEGIYNSSATVTNQVIGELWVSYRIVLTRPKLCSSILGASIPQDIITYSTSGTSIPTNPQLKLSNTLGGTLFGTGNSRITYKFPTNIVAGTYRVVWKCVTQGAAGIPLAVHVAGSNNVTWGIGPYSLLGVGIVPQTDWITTYSSVAAGHQMMAVDVRVDAPGTIQAQISLYTPGPGTIFTAAISAADNWFGVTQVSNNASTF